MRTKLVIILFLLTLGLVACEPEEVIVEVTRIVTETVVEQLPAEEIEVTRVVTEVEEVVVTATPDPRLASPQEVTRVVEVEVTRVVTATPDPNALAASTAGTPEVIATTELTGTLESDSQEATLIFSDNFDNGIGEEWEIRDKAAWASVNGQLTSVGGGSLIGIGDGTWTNYEVSFDVAELREIWTGCQLLIQSDQDGNATYDQWLSLFFGRWSPTGEIYWQKPNSTGDGEAVPGTVVEGVEPPFNLKIRVAENGSLTAFVDDKVISSVSMAGYGVGRPALWCEDEGISLDNFTVSALQE